MEAAYSRENELEDSLIACQDKYERLHESYKRVQKVNQSLEDKLLKLADSNATERGQLTSDVATLSVRIAQANYNISTLQREIERYKTDMSLAIQLLQCKPDNFVSQKVTSLPSEMQQKLSHYVRVDTNSHSDSEGSTSGIGTGTDNAYHILPASDSPVSSYRFSSSTTTSLVYCNGIPNKQNSFPSNAGDGELISPLGMAKYLEDKFKAANAKHCDTCLCANRDLRVLADIDPVFMSVETQTMIQTDINCVRCNCNLNSPSTTDNSPYMLSLVKSCDSIMSDIKNGGSCNDSSDKLIGKQDELVGNPILSHTPIGERALRKHSPPNRLSCDSSSTIQTNSKPFRTHNMTDSTGANSVNSTNHIDTRNSNNTMHDDDLALSKEVNPSHTQLDRTTNSSSLSNRSPIATLDGPKLFESFNRNLIKSIKAEKPNLSGPRLCALRISNASGNVLIDNVESDSTPIVYRRRSRFLDEELYETNVITTRCFPPTNQCDDERTYHRISMLMSNGVIDTSNDACIPDTQHGQSSLNNTAAVLTNDNHQSNADKMLFQPSQIIDGILANETVSKNPVDMIRFDGPATIDKGTISVKPVSPSSTPTPPLSQQMRQSPIVVQSIDSASNHQNHIGSATDAIESNDKQSLNMHQLRQSRSMSFAEESSILRRRQLSRVAEWVQNNSNHRTCLDGSASTCDTQPIDGNMNFDQISNIHHNTKDDTGNYSVDRIFNNNNNCNDIDANDILSTLRKAIDCGQLGYNANSQQLNSTNQYVDLAQMEYNVKQFFTKAK